mmetsp:Transcript_4357/g.6115  ORF Transcript_4357/g.6115 Transcript_4357/m.6115 type:complete len:548 (+) Transcript_4357:96-1739(+)
MKASLLLFLVSWTMGDSWSACQAFHIPPRSMFTKRMRYDRYSQNWNDHSKYSKRIPQREEGRITTNRYFLFCSKTKTSLNAYTSDAEKDLEPKGNNNNINDDASSRALGILVLLTVPLSWGTYAPVVKYVYEMDPPVPGLLFSAGYYFIASFTLGFLGWLQSKNQQQQQKQQQISDNTSINMNDNNSITPQKELFGGIELGSYLFIGNCFQVVGLESVPADRAAFLVQLTTVFVPMLQAFLARDVFAVPVTTWIACVLAFLGVLVMGMEDLHVHHQHSSSMELSSFFQNLDFHFAYGDMLIVASAFAYTLHVVRLGNYASSTTPIRLAAAKATVEALLSSALVAFLLFFSGSSSQYNNNNTHNSDSVTHENLLLQLASKLGQEISFFLQNFQHKLQEWNSSGVWNELYPLVGAILWTGWITCAYTIYAQSYGQRRVNPADANLIYSTQPIFSALFAFGLLGETLGFNGCIGGALIASALWLVASEKDSENIDNDKYQVVVVVDEDLTTADDEDENKYFFLDSYLPEDFMTNETDFISPNIKNDMKGK